MRYELIIYWSKEDQAFLVEVPELPGCMSDGASYEEAVANAQSVIIQQVRLFDRLLLAPRPKPPPSDYYSKPDFLTKNPLAFGFQVANLPRNEQQQPEAMAVAVEGFGDEAGDLPLYFPGGGPGLCAGSG